MGFFTPGRTVAEPVKYIPEYTACRGAAAYKRTAAVASLFGHAAKKADANLEQILAEFGRGDHAEVAESASEALLDCNSSIEPDGANLNLDDEDDLDLDNQNLWHTSSADVDLELEDFDILDADDAEASLLEMHYCFYSSFPFVGDLPLLCQPMFCQVLLVLDLVTSHSLVSSALIITEHGIPHS